nr:enoyl-CoA hydratase [Plesiomonas shigelloides]
MDSLLITRSDEGVLCLTFNRPEKKNALTLEMYHALELALRDAASDNRVRCVVLQGSERCFTAGNDLAVFLESGNLDHEHPAIRMLHTLAAFPKPVVAAVCGVAIGIGTTLLLHCDLVYVADDAVLQLPFIDLGLVPEFASSLLLPRTLGHVRACEWLLLSDAFSGAQAAHAGLANRSLPANEVFAFAHSQAIRLAHKPPHALRNSKALLKNELKQAVPFTIDLEARAFSQALHSEESRQRVSAKLSAISAKK